MTPLELKVLVLDLKARVAALEAKTLRPEAPPVEIPVVVQVVPQKSERKMCPYCGVKPNHFFHVKTCQKKNNKNGANKEADG